MEFIRTIETLEVIDYQTGQVEYRRDSEGFTHIRFYEEHEGQPMLDGWIYAVHQSSPWYIAPSEHLPRQMPNEQGRFNRMLSYLRERVDGCISRLKARLLGLTTLRINVSTSCVFMIR